MKLSLRILYRRCHKDYAFLACLFAIGCTSLTIVAQTNAAWTWVGGSNTMYGSGSYGTLGTPEPGNIPPGRYNAASWTDQNGNLWLFGGSGYDAATNTTGILLNDLWKFSPSRNEWTWMGGANTTGTQSPGTYGILGTPAAGNVPGCRSQAVSWADKYGNLWLFGGAGCDASGNLGELNDLWEYSPTTNEWTWIGGSNSVGPLAGRPGVYGTTGVPAAGNTPGSRAGALGWTDIRGNFWLLGGTGYDANGSQGLLNDLWEFDPSTTEWAWMGGSKTALVGSGWPGIYGTLGTPAAGNIPGSRTGAATWTDGNDNLRLFGGFGYDANGNLTTLNDLWDFEASGNEWAWTGGSSTTTGCVKYKKGLVICAGQPGVYGTLGAPVAGNIPGGRAAAASWIDQSGNYWLFGGQGYDAAGSQGNLNDLWMFNPGTNEWAWMGGNSTESDCGILMEGNTFCMGQPGEYGTLGSPGPGNEPGARSGSATWVDKLGNLWLFGGYGADSTGHGMGVLNDLWEYQQSTSALPAATTPAFTPAPGVYPSSQTVTLSDATPGANIYYTIDGSAPTASSTLYAAPITIAAIGIDFSETIEAIAVADGYSNSAMASATYTIKPPPDFSIAASPASLTIPAGKSGNLSVTVTQQNAFNSTIQFSCSGLPAGALCSFSPASVTPDIAPVSTTLTVTTSATTMAGFNSSPLLFLAAVLAPMLCCFSWRKRRHLQTLALLTVCAIGFGLLDGCSGASSKSHPLTAIVTVIATSGSLQHSTTFTLTLN